MIGEDALVGKVVESGALVSGMADDDAIVEGVVRGEALVKGCVCGGFKVSGVRELSTTSVDAAGVVAGVMDFPGVLL